jgi:soluble lytic murein transglycosylase
MTNGFKSFGLLTLLSIALSASAQSSDNQQQAIRAAVDSQNWQTVRSEIEKLRTVDDHVYQEKGYEYLLGRIDERSGSSAAATAHYQTVAARNSTLSQYALWRLARIARAGGDLVLERERLRQLLVAAPASLLHDAAALRLAESFFESSDFASAAVSARQVSLSQNVALAREGSALMGQSYVRGGKFAEARDVFTKLLMQMPDASRPDDFALTAARELDGLTNSKDIPATTLSEADHLLRASVYHFNRDFAGARIHYQAILDNYSQSGSVPNALYQLGRGYYLEGKYDDAIKYFQKTYDQYPQTPSARDALGFMASSYIRMKRWDDAIAAYKLSIQHFPDAPNPERPFLNVIDALHEAKRYPEGLAWVQQTRARFKNEIGGALALFAQMRIHLAQNAWTQVIADADELLKAPNLGGTQVAGGTTPQEVTFLRAVALELTGRTDEAVTAYLSIPAGRNEYYGDRATQRLLSLGADEKTGKIVKARLDGFLAAARSAGNNGQADIARTYAQSALRLTQDQTIRSETLKFLQASYSALPAYTLPTFNLLQPAQLKPVTGSSPPNAHEEIADNLLALGLYDEGMPELFAARAAAVQKAQTEKQGAAPQTQTKPGPSDTDYSLAVYSLKGGLPNRAVRFGEQLWKGVPPDYVLELAPRSLVELLYPAPYRELLVKHAASRNIDPRLVLSIARQESRYQSDAKSAAAARGMMQFIASTANEVATQLKLHDFNQDDLYSPDTAILFGSQYLANLFQQFPNQPDAVAAAYNGGADNVSRWTARSQAREPDRYVAEIGFSQTKDYVFKVMTNLWNYQRLYDAQLEPQSIASDK